MNLTQRLTEQNSGHTWRDCNYRNRPHRWHVSHVTGEPGDQRVWWSCDNCPVDTVTKGVGPKGWLTKPGKVST